MDSRDTVAQSAADEFQRRFGAEPLSIGVSPGRVNLIGEHTDYNGGFVLPAAVPYYTAVAFSPRPDGRVRVVSLLFDAIFEAPADTAPLGGFGDFPIGMARAIGYNGGFDATIASTVPVAGGMSSSAALLLATCRAIQALESPDSMPSDIDNARAARRAESDFVGVPCGLMDQFIVACAQEGSACLLDCLDETWVEVLADFPDARWAVVYSGIRRELSGGNYASKVRESMAALDRVAEATKLSREDLRILEADALYDACRRSRVHAGAAELLRHFVTENVRVGRMQRALEIGDAETAGGILTEGHWSLSQDFGVSLQSIDAFVRRAEAARGILGVRITGAGFGGSLLALLRGEEAYAGLREAAKVCLPPTHAILDIPGFCGGATGWKR